MTRSGSGPVLDIKGLTVALPPDASRPNAIEGVDLSVHPGEIVCLVGESGSGKSVTGYAAMGLLARGLVPTAGTLHLDGESLLDASPARRRALRGAGMSMVFQGTATALNPTTTVGRQVEEVLAIHGRMSRTERARRTTALFAEMRLPEPGRLRHVYPHQLSGGQRQRVMIAMALALNPMLLIADEPTTALDVTTQAQILRLIDTMRRTHGTAVLFITHDFGVVADIADRVVVMRNGRVVEAGAADTVLYAPQHGYTRTLIAAIPSLVPTPRAAVPLGPPLLSGEGLCKRYGGGAWPFRSRPVDAVVDAALELRRGETLGIIGESGSGKSTLARCIAQLTTLGSGTIRIEGADLATLSRGDRRRMRRRVQFIFQDPDRALDPRQRVLESLIEGPTNFGVKRHEAITRAKALAETVGLDPATLGRYPHAFSGGERQRLAIARALAVEPTLLIADEVVSALDVSVQARVLDLLEQIQRRFDLGMLFITHDLRVAARLCDRVAVMRHGRIVETGPTASVFAAPMHEYTRALLDAAPGQRLANGLPNGTINERSP